LEYLYFSEKSEYSAYSDYFPLMIRENRPYHTMDELLEKISTIEKRLFERIKKRFWCIN